MRPFRVCGIGPHLIPLGLSGGLAVRGGGEGPEPPGGASRLFLDVAVGDGQRARKPLVTGADPA